MQRRLILLGFFGILLVPTYFSIRHFSAEEQGTCLPPFVSMPYRLDRIYRSMEGPFSIRRGMQVTNGSTFPVQWLTGIESEVIDAAEQKPISQEFFCHSNLTFSQDGAGPARYNERAGGKTHLDWRLFTLVPGRMAIELPDGFGIPIPAQARLDYVTMSLNLNAQNKVVEVRMRTKLHAIAGDQRGAPTKALFRRALYVLQPQSELTTQTQTNTNTPHHVGMGCADFCRVNFSAVSTVGPAGEGRTMHWLVPPGHHVYATDVTSQFNLPFDTTIHYASIHVHPFATRMELRDLTTGATVLSLGSQDWLDRVGVARVDEFKSVSGIPIFRDHRYELRAEYENSSGAVTDAMAILYLYLLEKDFG